MSASHGVGIAAVRVGSRTSTRLPEGSRKAVRAVRELFDLHLRLVEESRTAFSHSCGERVKE
jgi:hypothetical protein